MSTITSCRTLHLPRVYYLCSSVNIPVKNKNDFGRNSFLFGHRIIQNSSSTSIIPTDYSSHRTDTVRRSPSYTRWPIISCTCAYYYIIMIIMLNLPAKNNIFYELNNIFNIMSFYLFFFLKKKKEIINLILHNIIMSLYVCTIVLYLGNFHMMPIRR